MFLYLLQLSVRTPLPGICSCICCGAIKINEPPFSVVWLGNVGHLLAGMHTGLAHKETAETSDYASLSDRSQSHVTISFSLCPNWQHLAWHCLWLFSSWVTIQVFWSSEVVINNSWKCRKSKCTHDCCFSTSYVIKKKLPVTVRAHSLHPVWKWDFQIRPPSLKRLPLLPQD